MRTHYLLPILLLTLFSSPFSRAQAQPVAPERKSLVENGGFELDAHDTFPPAGWRVWGEVERHTAERFVLDHDNPKAGSFALRIEHPRNTHAFLVSNPKQPIRTRPGRAYLVSFWSRTANDREPGVVYWENLGGSSPGQWPIPPSREWTQQTHEIHEGVDFFATETEEILLAFRPTRVKEAEQTLWIDEIVVSEVATTKSPLVWPESLDYARLNHRLTPGDRLEFRVDPTLCIGEAVRQAAGQSFHSLSGYGRHPYDPSGRYVLEPQLARAIADCRLPMTRFYAVGEQPWPIEETLDRTARLMDAVKIPKAWTVLELETQGATSTLPPEFWARAVRHSVDQALGFRHWEISNEPYTRKATAFTEPDDYVEHVIACSQAIKQVQPDARVGIGIHSTTQGWGNYVLKQAAGHYDFVVGHYYAHADQQDFKELTLSANYRMLDHILSVNALIDTYNPDRTVEQLDTEWGLVDAAIEDRPETRWRNSNIVAAMHRAVRLIHYIREGPLLGASGWEIFSRVTEDRTPGLAFLTRDAPDKALMNYWLYYHFNRHIGSHALDLHGTAPWHRAEDETAEGPVTPVLATLSDDGRTLYFVVANGSWDTDYPCTIHLDGVAVRSVAGMLLTQESRDAVGLVTKDQVTHSLPIKQTASVLRFTLPGHSVAFVSVTVGE